MGVGTLPGVAAVDVPAAGGRQEAAQQVLVGVGRRPTSAGRVPTSAADSESRLVTFACCGAASRRHVASPVGAMSARPVAGDKLARCGQTNERGAA